MTGILIATDLSARSEPPLDRALQLAAVMPQPLALLHVVDEEQPIRLETREAPLQALERLLDARGLQGPQRPEILLREGDPHATIVEVANDRNTGLLILGAPRARRFPDAFRGTTAERIIRTANIPVLIARRPPPLPWRHVMLTIDMSASSALAVRTARRLGLLRGARVSAVHALFTVLPGSAGYGGRTAADVAQEEVAEIAAARAELQGFLRDQDLGEIDVDEVVVPGAPSLALLRAVTMLGPDLVVLGTRGRSEIRRLVMGSVAEALLAKLETDVLVVPEGPAE